MPSKTPKQARTMAAAAHNPKFAEKMGIPQSVAQEFNDADAGSSALSSALRRQSQRQEESNGKTYNRSS